MMLFSVLFQRGVSVRMRSSKESCRGRIAPTPQGTLSVSCNASSFSSTCRLP